jgi:alkanesulfonate monooxygenase SsuD/methylene tetrahydromethanopterin reductase-like flavin-dependent oxidoreductase (luciferase family)
MASLSFHFDLRSSPTGATHAELTTAVLDICEWADRLENVAVTARVLEHHFSKDGYNPSPITLAAAIAGRTRRMAISAVVLLSFYHPLRLAEDLALLDLLSRGRLSFILAAGYRREEFDGFGVELHDRGRLMEEGISTLKKAWTGEPFEFRGKTVQVMPRPFQQPRPPIIMGGSSKAAARRAARIADGFAPTDPALLHVYRDELIALGKDPGPEPPSAGVGGTTLETLVAVSEDPDATWKEVAPHCLYEINTYFSWLRGTPAGVAGFWEETNADVLREKGRYLVLTPEELVRRAQGQGGAITIEPLLGGVAPEIAWRSLQLIAAKVLPALQ